MIFEKLRNKLLKKKSNKGKDEAFEICIKDMVDEFNRIIGGEKCIVEYTPIEVPKYMAGNMRQSKKYVKDNELKMNINFDFGYVSNYTIRIPVVGTMLDNGDKLINHLTFFKGNYLYPDRYSNKIVVRIDCDHRLMSEKMFKECVLNCANKKEETETTL